MTKGILRQASIAGAVAAGAVLLVGGAAHAGPDITSAGNQGVGNGNQVVAPIQAPIDLCGNAVSVAGISGAGCDGGSAASMNEKALGDMTSAGNQGVGNGNQVQAPIQAPIDVCGNGVAVAGVTGAGCTGGSAADLSKNGGNAGKSESAPVTENGSDLTTAANNGLANGNQVKAPIQAPISACGNAVAVAGASGAGCTGGASADMGHKPMSDMTSVGNQGVGNGNQVQAPIQAPIDASGNAVGVAGISGAGSTGGSAADMGPSWLGKLATRSAS